MKTRIRLYLTLAVLLCAACYGAYDCWVNDQTSCLAVGSPCVVSSCVNGCGPAFVGSVTEPGIRNICTAAAEDEHGWSDCISWGNCGYTCSGNCPICGVQNSIARSGPPIKYATNMECDG